MLMKTKRAERILKIRKEKRPACRVPHTRRRNSQRVCLSFTADAIESERERERESIARQVRWLWPTKAKLKWKSESREKRIIERTIYERWNSLRNLSQRWKRTPLKGANDWFFQKSLSIFNFYPLHPSHPAAVRKLWILRRIWGE